MDRPDEFERLGESDKLRRLEMREPSAIKRCRTNGAGCSGIVQSMPSRNQRTKRGSPFPVLLNCPRFLFFDASQAKSTSIFGPRSNPSIEEMSSRRVLLLCEIGQASHFFIVNDEGDARGALGSLAAGGRGHATISGRELAQCNQPRSSQSGTHCFLRAERIKENE